MWNTLKNAFRDWQTRRAARRRGELPGRRFFNTERWGEALNGTSVPAIFTFIVVWVSCIVVLSLSTQQQLDRIRKLVPDQPVPQTITARFDFSCTDFSKMKKLAEEARENTPDYFSLDAQSSARILAAFKEFFQTPPETLPPAALRVLQSFRQNPDHSLDFVLNRLQEVLQKGVLADADKKQLSGDKRIIIIDERKRQRRSRPCAEIPDVSELSRMLAMEVLRNCAAETDADRMPALLQQAFQKLFLSQGNLFYDQAATEEALDKVVRSDMPVKLYQKGETIALRDEIATEELCRIVKEYALEESRRASLDEGREKMLSYAVWSLILLIFSYFYLYHLHPDVIAANKRVMLLGGVVMVSLFVSYGLMLYYDMLVSATSWLPGYFRFCAIPVILTSVILAVIFGYRVSLCAGFFVMSIIVLMLQSDRSLEELYKGLVLCSAAGLAVRSATNYRSFFFRVLAVNIPLSLLLNADLPNYLIGTERLFQELLIYGSVIGVTSLTTALTALMIIFFLEMVFNVSTNMALMVLCDYNHPLLEQLKREAPGTFFHSLMVATLAEDAARAIHANPLKAKVGALFHDIGKLQRPQYFTENNFNQANLHTNLNPQMSSIIIRDHVKDGLEMARQYRLCRTIRDAIEQHHGTDLVRFFYRKALEAQKDDGSEVLESQYRYAGRLPHDKEMAIISLADACEAACRSIDKATLARIEQVVDEIFLGRYQDGQLDDANLSLADLHKIRQSFIQTIVSMRHGRIAYQKEQEIHEDAAVLEKPAVPPAGQA